MQNSTIGARLIAAREHSKLSLENIAEQTQLPLKRLEAFENDEIKFDEVTAFDAAYLKKYCQFIGVVYDDLFADLKIKSINGNSLHKDHMPNRFSHKRRNLPIKQVLIACVVTSLGYYFLNSAFVSSPTNELQPSNHLILDAAINQNI